MDERIVDTEDFSCDVRCAKCGETENLVLYALAGLPLMALCQDCDQKES